MNNKKSLENPGRLPSNKDRCKNTAELIRAKARCSKLSLIIILSVILFPQIAYATLSNYGAYILTDNNGDGIAGIGDVIRCFTDSNNYTPGVTPYVDSTSWSTDSNILNWVVGNTFRKDIYVNKIGYRNTTYMAEFIDNNDLKQTAMQIHINTRRPAVTSAVASINSGNSIGRVGDVVRIECEVSNFTNVGGDNTTPEIYASCTGIISGLKRMSFVSSSGNVAIYRTEVTLTSSMNYENDNTLFQIRITTPTPDNAQIWADTNTLRIDTRTPQFNPPCQIQVRRDGVPTGTTARINDQLYIWGDLTTPNYATRPLYVRADLSSIGGSSNTIVNLPVGTTSYSLYYNITPGSSDDTIPRSFTVRAYDEAGNTVYENTTPIIYVDNIAPTISNAQLTKIGTGSNVKLGDTVQFQATVTNIDGGTVWIDARNIGGAASQTLSLVSGSTYRVQLTVGESLTGVGLDQAQDWPIFVVDNVGNSASAITNTLNFDNIPPVITSATYATNFTPSPSHPRVRVGDRLEFRVSLASSGATVYDGQTVTINMTSLGGVANQGMTYDGVGTYTYVVNSVPTGNLNSPTNFPVTAIDNAGNIVTTNILVDIDNSPPVAAPMVVSINPDLPKVGAINCSDTVTFTVSCTDPDVATAWIDLSLIGSSSQSVMTYNSGLGYFETTWQAGIAGTENSSYYFRALVTDKSGNSMYSFANAAYEVDCRPPVINWVQAAKTEYAGDPNIANVGDKLTITASIDLATLDGGTPRVNLAPVGGSSNQQLYDDGNHDDGAPGDGVYGYSMILGSGTLDGAVIQEFTVEVTDNCGNKTVRTTTNGIRFDIKPIQINYFLVSTFDANSNSTVDLDGDYGATDAVRLQLRLTAAAADFPANPLTVDLSKLGYSANENITTYTNYITYRDYDASYTLKLGDTNRENTYFLARAVDVNGNVTLATSTPAILIDNKPPSIVSGPTLSFVQDNGVQNEANLGDIVRVTVEVNNNDGVAPILDLQELSDRNGGVIGTTKLTMSGGPSVWAINWTVPAGLGTPASLPVRVYDVSRNLVVGRTGTMMFLSRTPIVKPYPDTYCTLTDTVGAPNVANVGDTVNFRLILHSGYTPTNTPPATICVDIRAIRNNGNDDPGYNDGDPNTYWAVLPAPAPALQDWEYMASFVVQEGGRDYSIASFPYKVLHPTNPAVVLASGTIECNPANPFGIDTLFPNIYQWGINIAQENGDNVSSAVANIGDQLYVWARISNYNDPGSVSMRLLSSTTVEIYNLPMTRVGTTDIYGVTVSVATFGVAPWTMSMRGPAASDNLRYEIWVTDDAENTRNRLANVSTFTVDNTPNVIVSYTNIIRSVGTSFTGDNPFVGFLNIATGTASDSLIASITVDTPPHRAWIDLSAIQGTSTYFINFGVLGSTTIGNSGQFVLATSGIQLQQVTLPIIVRDTAGNITATETTVWIDTARPTLASATYDGERLRLTFSETIKMMSYPGPESSFFDQTSIRIGKQAILDPFDSSSMVQLTAADMVATPSFDSNRVDIILAPSTRAAIADWGEVTLWMTAGYDLSGAGDVVVVCRDLAGNPMMPIPAQPSNFQVGFDPYVLRPNLISGLYDGRPSAGNTNKLFLNFDRQMAVDSFTDNTLPLLSIVKDPTYDGYPINYQKRYVMQLGTDTVGTPVSNFTLVASLSQDAQDWIAMKFKYNSYQLGLAIAAPVNINDPPLCRDTKGNKVNPIAFTTPLLASLTPHNLPFSISTATLTIQDTQTILRITATERIRLFLGEDPFKPPSAWPKTNPNVNGGRIFLYKRENRTGPYITLSQSTLEPSMNDYSSTTVTLKLHISEIQTILSWNTDTIWIAIESGAFRDLWDNTNTPFVNGTNAWPLPKLTPPPSATPPKFVAFATSDKTPIKDYTTPGALYYEVEFEESTFVQNGVTIPIPINREVIPSLILSATDTIEVASFTNWRERMVGSGKRVIAKFNGTGNFLGKPLDRAPASLTVSNVCNVFNQNINPNPATHSYVFWIGDQIDTGTGYRFASEPLIIDTVEPGLVSVVPTGTIGIKPAGAATFTVTFNELMDTTVSEKPTLVLRTVAAPQTTAMTFTFQSWIVNPTTNTASQAVFVNAAPFDNTSPQGLCQYYVSGGYDLAGNRGLNNMTNATATIEIRSMGPNISSIVVTTYQTTVATAPPPAGYATNRPFSPDVPPGEGIATITINYSSVVNPTGIGTHWLYVYEGESILRASYPIDIDAGGMFGIATFSGRDIANIIGSGPKTFNLRVLDNNKNEGSMRGILVYDAAPPKLTSWTLSNAKLRSDGKVYFSPAVHSYLKIDIGDLNQSENLLLRVTNTSTPEASTDTYMLAQWPGNGHTINFSGRSATKPNNPYLAQNSTGTFLLHVVDEAGNLGVSAVTPDRSSASVEIDNTNPNIAGMTLHRADNGAQVTRFNPRVTNLEIRVATTTTDFETVPGRAFIRIKSGSRVVRDDLGLTATGTVLVATWDGNNGSGTLVTDGTYNIELVDMAENPAAISPSVTVITSVFKVTSVKQINKQNILVTFSHDVNTNDATDPTRYTISGSNGGNLTVGAPLTMVGSNSVMIPLSTLTPLVHGVTYTLTIATTPPFRSYDGDPLTNGNNVMTMTPAPADVQGPSIHQFDFSGVTNPRIINVVFDEEVASTTATNKANYTITTSTDTVPIDSVVQISSTTVRVTVLRDIVEGVTYTMTASGVTDLYQNVGYSTKTFTGKDVTPPQLTVSVFSNPANEFDIIVAVKSNEDISGNPVAVVTQSGGMVTNITLNQGPNARYFMGGTLLSQNTTQGTVQVTATDAVGNSGTSLPLTFNTAYVNASIRAEISSPDGNIRAVFLPGTLKQNSFVSIMPIDLEKVASSATTIPGIKAKVLAGLSSSQIRGMKLGLLDGTPNEELTPLGIGYSINVPPGRIVGELGILMKMSENVLPKGVGIFRLGSSGQWEFVTREVKNGWASFLTKNAGIFALIKDEVAPRASILTKIDRAKPFRDPRPTFEWEISDGGSGLDIDSIKVILNDKEFPGNLNDSGTKVSFKPYEPLVGGEHTIALSVADKTGNITVTPAIMFLVQPPLVIHEMSHFPNPARTRVVLRIGTNRPDITPDLVQVTIYDAAGHKVKDSRGLEFRGRISGSRRIHEMTWDLTNDDGDAVANGVYFAKVQIIDPDNADKKTKVIHKIAVLR